MVWNIIYYHYSIYFRNKIYPDHLNWLFSAIFRNTIYRDVFNLRFSVGFRTLGHLENTSNCFYWLFEYKNQSDLMFRRSGLGIQLSFRNNILMDQSYHIIYFFGLFFRSSSSKLAFLLRKHRFSKVFSPGGSHPARLVIGHEFDNYMRWTCCNTNRLLPKSIGKIDKW